MTKSGELLKGITYSGGGFAPAIARRFAAGENYGGSE